MFSCDPMLTSLTCSVIRGSLRAYSSSSATVPSSETLSQITNSRSAKSCDKTDSMQRTDDVPAVAHGEPDRERRRSLAHRRARYTGSAPVPRAPIRLMGQVECIAVSESPAGRAVLDARASSSTSRGSSSPRRPNYTIREVAEIVAEVTGATASLARGGGVAGHARQVLRRPLAHTKD